MRDILDAFKLIAEEEGISLTKLEEKLGASKGVLSRAIKHNTGIHVKWVIALVEKYPHYSSHWILTGKGNMKNDGQSINNLDSIDRLIDEKIEGKLNDKLKVLKELILLDIEKEMTETIERIDSSKKSTNS